MYFKRIMLRLKFVFNATGSSMSLPRASSLSRIPFGASIPFPTGARQGESVSNTNMLEVPFEVKPILEPAT